MFHAPLRLIRSALQYNSSNLNRQAFRRVLLKSSIKLKVKTLQITNTFYKNNKLHCEWFFLSVSLKMKIQFQIEHSGKGKNYRDRDHIIHYLQGAKRWHIYKACQCESENIRTNLYTPIWLAESNFKYTFSPSFYRILYRSHGIGVSLPKIKSFVAQKMCSIRRTSFRPKEQKAGLIKACKKKSIFLNEHSDKIMHTNIHT